MAFTGVTPNSPASLQPGVFRRIKLKDGKRGGKPDLLDTFCLWPEQLFSTVFLLWADPAAFLQAVTSSACVTRKGVFVHHSKFFMK